MNSLGQLVRTACCTSLLLFGCAFSMSSCVTHEHGDGQIYVDRPEVFTRERLLNRRLTEQYWLEQQLEKPVNTSFQGYRDVREFKGFYGRAEAQLDPTAYIKGDADKIAADTARTNAETARLKAMQARELAAQDLAKVVAGSEPSAKATDTKPTDPAKDAATSNGWTSAPSDSSLFTKASTEGKAPLPDPSAVDASKASLTSIEMLRDQAAYRNTVQAYLREQELDDTHDLYGRTLYTLKFDIGVLAGEQSNALALVHCTLTRNDVSSGVAKTPDKNSTSNDASKPSGKQSISHESFYGSWIANLKDQLRDDAIARQKRWLKQDNQSLGEKDQRDIALAQRYLDESTRDAQPQEIRLSVDAATTGIFDPDKKLKALAKERTENAPPEERQESPEDRSKRIAETMRLLAFTTVAPLLRPLSPYVKLIAMEELRLSGQTYYIPALEPASNGAELFDSKLATLDNDNFYVYTVEPKELAQNISDVAAKETLLNLVGSLSASVPQASFASVKAYAEYVHRSQRLLHGILRKPLVVGFAPNRSEFSWIFGPRFGISDGGEATFAHTPVQQSVQASIVVPGWWRSISVKSEASWIDSEGNSVRPDTKAQAFNIDLPGDVSAITTFLLAPTRGSRPEPRISDVIGSVAPGQATLLIRGQELWRNPEVYLEAQRASRVQVLPDMRGISASWSGLEVPPGRKPGELIAVRVVTSGGMDEHPVALVDRGATLPARRFLTLQSQYAAPDGNTKTFARFGVDSSGIPGAFAGLKLIVAPLDPTLASQAFEVATYSPSLATRPQSIQWDIAPATPPAWWTKSDRVFVNAQVQMLPGGPWTDASGGPVRLVHFGSADDAKASLTANSIDVGKEGQLELGVKLAPNTELLLEAFPTFAAAWNSGSVVLQLYESIHSDKRNVRLTVKRDGNVYATGAEMKDAVMALGKVALGADPKEGDSATFVVSLVDERGNAFPIALKDPSLKVTYP